MKITHFYWFYLTIKTLNFNQPYMLNIFVQTVSDTPN